MTAERGRQPNDHVRRAMITEVLLNMFRKRVAIMLVVCLLVSLVTVTGVVRSRAEESEEEFVFANEGFENAQTVEVVEGDNVTLTFAQGSNAIPPKYYTGGSAVRLYTGNTLTVTSDYCITAVDFVFVSDGYHGSFANWSAGEEKTGSVLFTNTASGQTRIVSMTVTISDEEAPAGDPTPTPTPSATPFPENPTAEEIWDAVNDGSLTNYECTLTGVVTSIVEPYTTEYGNISVYMVVDGLTEKPFECFRMVNGADIAAGEGIEVLKVNDTITVSGKVKKYNTTIEFDKGCTLDALVAGEDPQTPTYDTPEEIWDAANELANNAILPGGPYTLTGVVTGIPTAYSEQHGNVTIDIVVDELTDKPFRCFRLKNGESITEGEGVEIVAVGDTVTVTGEITKYNGVVEFAQNCTLDELVKGETPTYDTAEELWDAANELADNGTLPGGPFEVTGVVTEIVPKYTSLDGTNKYISVFIVCDGIEDKPFECFKMVNGDDIAEGKGIELLDVGDTITVSGNVQKYVKSEVVTIEFTSGCKLIEIDHIARITSASLSLSDSIAINFKVNENEFDETLYIPALKVTFAGEETALGAVKKGTDYVFTFGELAPDQMTEIAGAQLYLLEVSGSGLDDGIACGSKDYSIAQYCYNQLRKETNAENTNTEFLKVLVDLLKYGDAAMEYTGKTGTKPTSELTEAELALGSAGDPDVSDFGDKQINAADGDVVWKGAGLNLTDSIMIRVKFQADLDEDGLYVVYMDNDEKNIHLETTSSNFMAVPGADNTYYAFFALPSPLELLTEFSFTLEDAYEEIVYGDELVYSAGAYVKSMLGKTNDAKLAALLNAMTNYCLSVIDYVG